MSILQKHLLTGFKFLKNACYVIAILCTFFKYCALFQLHKGRGIKVKCMKRVDGNKERFIWRENDKGDEDIMIKIKF